MAKANKTESKRRRWRKIESERDDGDEEEDDDDDGEERVKEGKDKQRMISLYHFWYVFG